MFGMTAGSLLIYFNAGRFTAERMLEHLSWISWGFALAVVGSALMIISTVILSQTSVVMMTFLWAKTILIVLPPYVLAGMAISLALTMAARGRSALSMEWTSLVRPAGACWCWR